MESRILAPISSEFAEAQLGDLRLTHRLMTIADAAAKNPGRSLPGRARTEAELEGTYRFLENERVTAEAVLESHLQHSVGRAHMEERVLIIHDTTVFKFGGDELRDGLGWLQPGDSQGFFGHFSFCASRDGRPLGTLGLHVWVRQGKAKRRRGHRTDQFDPSRESLRWQESALRTGELLFEHPDVVHVMDSEGDNYELLALLVEHNQRFVIRLCHDRRLVSGRAETSEKLFESLSKAPFSFDREVALSSRKAKKKGTAKFSRHPARAGRVARLEVRATSKEIFIGNGAPAHLPPSLTLNFVEVREANPPDGEKPIEWRLVTSEPIDTEADLADIIDAYCRRWTIEEFFKALKTGCRYQMRQLETAHALLIDLAIETAVAWRILLARWLARQKPEKTLADAFNPAQIAVLPALAQRAGRPLPSNPTVGDALFAIARLGGHIKNNGPPGWLVLRRGFEQLHLAEYTYCAMLDQGTAIDVINE